MKHQTDIEAPAAGGGARAGRRESRTHDGPRPLGLSLRRGWKRRCPGCGGGGLFDGYVKVRDACMVCGEELHHHRADDLPAWLTIIVVGHLMAPMLLVTREVWSPPMWVHWSLWPTLTLGLTLLLLPRFKAMVVALQWSQRMGGFAADEKGAGGR